MTARCCIACGHVYAGPLACPMCREPGEPQVSVARAARGCTAQDYRAGRCDWDDLPSEEVSDIMDIDFRPAGAIRRPPKSPR